VGTEDGLLARCSTSYSEQYLDVTAAHAGPVNRVRLSPFLPDALLTASSDGSAKLFNVGAGGAAFAKGAAIAYALEDAADAVADVAWSPSVSTRFATVTRDGHLTVWDAAVITRPALDLATVIEPDEYAALERAAADEAVARVRAQWARERAALRASMGDEEADDPAAAAADEARDEELAGAIADIRAVFHVPPPPAPEGAPAPPARRRKAAGAGGYSRYAVPPPLPGPPPKKLSCVLFGDNTHVVLTGDASGRVDVYRVLGLPGAEDGAPAPPVGSEHHEAQLDSLRAIMATL